MATGTVTPAQRVPKGTIPNAPDIRTAPMLEKFRAILAGDNELARVARFLVRIEPAILMGGWKTITDDLVFLCDSAELPGRGFVPQDTRYYGPSFKIPVQSSYPDITMSFICRNRFQEREFFDTWFNQINPPNTYDFKYPMSYQTNIQIFQFDDEAKPIYAFELQKAYPLNLNPQQVTWADDQSHRLGVQFAYTRWIPLIGTKDTDPTLKDTTAFELAIKGAPDNSQNAVPPIPSRVNGILTTN